jgi:hypothetical protein
MKTKIANNTIQLLKVGLVSTKKSNILGAVLAVVSSIALFCYVVFGFLRFFKEDYGFKDYVRIASNPSLGVTTGHPLWKLFQSRVLGPYLIKALSFGSLEYYGEAYVCFQIVTVAIAAFLCWRLGREYGGSDRSASLALMLFVMCFASLLSPPLLYSWDFIDIIVFLVFIDFVLSGRSLPWFLGLFAIAIFNRDSAIFIALWLILDPLVRFFYQRRRKLPKKPTLDWQRIIAGIICIGAALIILELLRRNLLVQEEGPKIFPGSTDAGNGYNSGLLRNIEFLKHPLSDLRFWIVVPFLTIVTVLGAKLVRLDPQRYLAIYLIQLSMLVALVLFALLYEMRTLLILIPFVVISSVLESGAKKIRTKAA